MTQLRYLDLRALRVLTVALALVACDQGAPKTAGDRDVIASSNESARAADAGALDAGALDAATDAPLGKAVGFELPRNTSDTENCIKLVVGTAKEQAELCDDFSEGYWRVTHQVVRVRRARKTVTVLDVITKVEGFDTGATMLETRLRIAADGMSATLDGVPAKPDAPQPTPGNPSEDCKSAPPTREDEATERANYGRPTYGELRRRMCDARGAYRWTGGRFTRVR